VNKWLLAGLLAAAAAIAVVVVLTRNHEQDAMKAAKPAPRDPLIEEFRATERQCIAAFNADLARQRANEIDELALAAAIEKDVLTPWRDIRGRILVAPIPKGREDLYVTLRRYLEARQTAWEAYAEALRAGSDEAARPHYDVYHQKHAEAQDVARELGRMFREM
jgi:hypothetical protein